MRSLLVVILLVGVITSSAQQAPDSTTSASTIVTATTDNTTDDSTTSGTTTQAGTSGGSGTGATSSSTTSNSIITSNATVTTTKPNNNQGSTAASSTKTRPVSDNCFDRYKICTETHAPTETKNNQYCVAYNKSESCITNTSSSTQCNPNDLVILEFLACQPSTFFGATSKDVPEQCQGQITECLSVDPLAKNITTSTNFTMFFCAVVKDKVCLTSGKRCSEGEYNAARKKAGCSTAHALISSFLVIALVLLAQGVIKAC